MTGGRLWLFRFFGEGCFFLFVFRAENRNGGLFQQVFEVY